MLLGLVVRRRVEDLLALLTAFLGLVWNIGGLAALFIRDFAGRQPDPLVVALSYAALGFLPAVVVHSVLRTWRTQRTSRAVIAVAYAASSVAAGLMFLPPLIAPSAIALTTLTWSYAALIVPVLILTRNREGSAPGLSIVALAVFAITALHLSHEGASESWLVALGHHASIPLIFAILYQDFRFALADLFLKRALALFALVGVSSAVYFGVEVPLFARHDFHEDPVAVGVSIATWMTVAVLYPSLRRLSGRVVDRFLLRRVDYVQFRRDVFSRIADAAEPDDVLDIVAAALRAPLAANEIRWTEGGAAADDGGIAILIYTTERPQYSLLVGPLTGGRRLLSDDAAMLDDVALLAARRIDSIRLARERYERSLREEEMGRLATEAELRALRAQINPHFFFNALNTIAYLIRAAPSRASETLIKLTSLLRSVLHSGDPITTLGEEIDLITTYLEIEQARFEDRLEVSIVVPDELRDIRILPLLIQPLVENAIKHGIANSRTGGRLLLTALMTNAGLVITVVNGGTPTNDLQIAHGRKRGIGLANLDARLRRYYGDETRVMLETTTTETLARIVLPVGERDAGGFVEARGA
jgi:hypothetical protein